MKRKNKLDKERLSEVFGSQLFYYDVVDSTMDEAKRLIVEDKISNKAIVISSLQTGGKGRRGRSWVSPEGGIWLTYVIKPRTKPEQYPLYTLMSAVSIVKFLELQNIEVKIKWPNDIILESKKLAGIAIDLVIKECSYLIIGLGLNVHNDVIETGTSLAKANSEIDITSTLIYLIESLDKYQRILENNFSNILELWREHNNILGNEVNIYPADGKDPYQALAIDINSDGSLRVKVGNEYKDIVAADVSLRLV
jgi:BirA family biotin operon repressor/biotin-[acetyl-CoA-carboxylase] ligase